MWNILLSFLMMRVLPVRWWSALVVVVILLLGANTSMVVALKQWLKPIWTTPTYHIERIEGGVVNKTTSHPG